MQRSVLNGCSYYWVPEPNTGCYIWIGGLRGTRSRRPAIKDGYVARLVCTEANGPPPTSKHEAAHKRQCCGELCVNGEHVYWATRSQNEMDKPLETRVKNGVMAAKDNPRFTG